MQGRARVVFVDAALIGPEPFSFDPVTAESVPTITTHAMSPGALLRVYDQVIGGPPPDCRLLAIRGYAFDLGAALSPGAAANLEAALAFLIAWLSPASGILPGARPEYLHYSATDRARSQNNG